MKPDSLFANVALPLAFAIVFAWLCNTYLIAP